jgi:hypothetical protein
MLDIVYLPLLAGFSPLSTLSKSVEFGEGTGVRLVGWLGYSLFFRYAYRIISQKTHQKSVVPPSFRGTNITSLNPKIQVTMGLCVNHSFISLMNIRIAIQRLTCMRHACIISLASALAGCQGVRLFVSRLPHISA